VKRILDYSMAAVISGFLLLLPVYLAMLLLAKAASSALKLVQPFALLIPDWLPGERILSLLLVMLICFVVGAAIRTRAGRSARERLEQTLFERIPGYAMFRSLSQRLTGRQQDTTWKPALAEIEKALVPAFIIEEVDDTRLTVFVPSIPTPLAGAVYVLTKDRVHPVDVSFTQAVSSVSRWGSGVKELVRAMEATRQAGPGG
jgi:uncharacterized membrane protein